MASISSVGPYRFKIYRCQYFDKEGRLIWYRWTPRSIPSWTWIKEKCISNNVIRFSFITFGDIIRITFIKFSAACLDKHQNRSFDHFLLNRLNELVQWHNSIVRKKQTLAELVKSSMTWYYNCNHWAIDQILTRVLQLISIQQLEGIFTFTGWMSHTLPFYQTMTFKWN